ncbi:LamG-like jellyroll fold domain-containing protein [Paludisphaera rhizosphaerae]|uniref:LamG-like jellyroll fold domain-containing protein n=1 Tax=Paludisphaera rhizosphaerae TaxID=2711216 RepID=UPI0013ED0159|nr:LamG-like jellyroll fold domain-containing protein [Paludisphaera rhizosphaerae]
MDPDLRDLLAAWRDDRADLDDAEQERLLQRLHADEELRRAFAAELWMDAKVQAVLTPEPNWPALDALIDGRDAVPSPIPSISPPASLVNSFPFTTPLHRRPFLRAAAAAILVAAALAGYFLRPRSEPTPVPQIAKTYEKVDATSGLAMIVKLDDVNWGAGDEAHPGEGDILAPGPLRFESGRMMISMLTGVTMAVEGPAELDLVSNDKVVCKIGKVRVRSTAGSRGFIVAGPDSAVLDLGTEFGMNVSKDGKSRARVFDGVVESAVTAPDGSPQRTRLFTENQAFEINPSAGAIEKIEEVDEFLSATKLQIPPLNLAPSYSAAVRADEPWGYWRFESIEEATTPSEVAGRPAFKVIGPIHTVEAGPEDRCLEFPDGDGFQLLEFPELWRPTWETGFAFEFWAAPEKINHSSLVSVLDTVGTDSHILLLEMTARNLLHKPASVRFLHRWPPGWRGGDNLYSQTPYVPYRWHHVVAQFHEGKLEVYLNGRPMPSLSVAAEHADKGFRFMLGRLTSKTGHGISIDRNFVGRLDEFAVYDHPLSLERIQEHHRLGSSAALKP